MIMNLSDYLHNFPFIAITRGIQPTEAASYGQVLVEMGFRLLEVPLNSPDPYHSIKLMSDNLGKQAITGAGTVTEVNQIALIKEAGGTLVISPHCDPDIIRAAIAADMTPIPGVATPTEAMTAIKAGASALKLFPAESITPSVVKAMRAVLPTQIALIPVGGIIPSNWQQYHTAGANGFGLGSSLYKAGDSIEQVKRKGMQFVQSWQQG